MNKNEYLKFITPYAISYHLPNEYILKYGDNLCEIASYENYISIYFIDGDDDSIISKNIEEITEKDIDNLRENLKLCEIKEVDPETILYARKI